jgi:hypothetical protein
MRESRQWTVQVSEGEGEAARCLLEDEEGTHLYGFPHRVLEGRIALINWRKNTFQPGFFPVVFFLVSVVD